MFKCKVCTEKDARIVDLQKQIQLLTSAAFPSSISNHDAFVRSLEANKILSGDTSTQIEIETPTTEGDDFNTWS